MRSVYPHRTQTTQKLLSTQQQAPYCSRKRLIAAESALLQQQGAPPPHDGARALPRYIVYRLRPGPVRDFGTERALVEPLGPIYMIFPSSSPRGTLLTELNLTVPKARPEAHTFDFIGAYFEY